MVGAILIFVFVFYLYFDLQAADGEEASGAGSIETTEAGGAFETLSSRLGLVEKRLSSILEQNGSAKP